jgi:hypothetical protein
MITCDASLHKRRLEVRFEGESGFVAASGDEAGITRGLYADIAEALLIILFNQLYSKSFGFFLKETAIP